MLTLTVTLTFARFGAAQTVADSDAVLETDRKSAVQWLIENQLPLDVETLNKVETGQALARMRWGARTTEQQLDRTIRDEVFALRTEAATSRLRLQSDGMKSQRISATAAAAPRIDSVSPSSGTTAGGTTVFLSGKSFQDGATVSFGGVAGTQVTYYDCTYLSVRTPAATVAGPVPVTVTNLDGSSASLPSGFTYTIPGGGGTTPGSVNVSGISPATGPTAGGTSLTIQGSGFVAGMTVQFLSRANEYMSGTNLTVVNSSTLTVVTPVGASGFASIYVRRPDGGAVLFSDGFLYTGPTVSQPTITSFTASAAPGAAITINGTNFHGISGVYFPIHYNEHTTFTSASFQRVSDTQLTVTVPSRVSSGPILIRGIFGSVARCDSFTVSAGAPTITSLGSGSVAYRTYNLFTPIAITGTNLVDIVKVTVGGRSVDFWSVNSTTLNIEPVPGDVDGQVVVTTRNGSATSAGSLSIVQPEFCIGPAPTVSSMYPTTVYPGDEVFIYGANFQETHPNYAYSYPYVLFPGASTVWSQWLDVRTAGAQQVSPWVEPDTISGPVYVITDFGIAASPSLTVNPLGAPAVSSPSLNLLRSGYGEIAGSNLAGVHDVRLGDMTLYSRYKILNGIYYSNILEVEIPWNAVSGTLTLESRSGTTTIPLNVTCDLPTITGFSVSSAKPNTYIDIVGSNFPEYGPFTTTNQVWFNGVKSTYAYSANTSRTRLTVLVPQNAVSGPVTVVTPFGVVTSAAQFTVQRATPTDFNADGKSDILLQNTADGRIAEWLMNGLTINGSGVVANPGTSWVPAATGDFNGDGKADISLQNTASGEVAVWLMNGTTLTGGVLVANPGTSWKPLATGDFNADGKTDILLQNTSTGDVAVWLMNGGAMSGTAVVGNPGLSWVVKGTGDTNGDGKSDILLQNTSTGEVAGWQMNGLVRGTSQIIGAPGISWVVRGLGDLGGDGKHDLVLQNSTSGDVASWQMNGFAFTGAIVGAPGTSWIVGGSGDYNGDGKGDVLLQNSGTRDVAGWLMNGSTRTTSNIIATPESGWTLRLP